MKKILFGILLLGAQLYAWDIKTNDAEPVGSWDFRGGTIYTATPTISGQAANKDYVDLQFGAGGAESDPVFISSAPDTYLYKTEKAADSDLLDNHDESYFAVRSSWSLTAASTGTIKTALDEEIADTDTNFNNVATDTTTNANNLTTEIANRKNGDSVLGVSTGTIYAALQSTGATLSEEIATTDINFENVAIDTSTLRTDLNTEISDRIGGDAALGVSTGTIYAALNSTAAALSAEITRAVARENDIAVSTGTNAADIYDLQVSTGENKDRIAALEYSTAVLSGQVDSLQGQITTNDDAIEAIGISTGGIYTALQSTAAALSDHIANDGSDHSYINQDVTSGSSPTFDGSNFTGVVASSVTANHVYINNLNSATYDTSQDYIYIAGSAGRATGGQITDNGDGTISVSSGTGMIRTTASSTATLVSFDFDGKYDIDIASGIVIKVYIDYNGGNVEISTTAATTEINGQTQFGIGLVYKNGDNTMHHIDTGLNVYDWRHRARKRVVGVRGFEREFGGVIAETGERYLTSTTGKFWHGNNPIETTTQDTSDAARFIAWYRGDAGDWISVSSLTQVDNTAYDDGSGSTVALTNNYYMCQYAYVHYDSDINVVYGQEQFLKLIDAQLSDDPATIPSVVNNFGILAARIIVKEGEPNFIEIDNRYIIPYKISTPPNHPDLGTLAWTNSGHTGTASTFAGFDGAGAAEEYTISDYAIAADLSLTAATTGQIYDELKSTGAALSVEIIATNVDFENVATDTTTIYTALRSTGAALSDEIVTTDTEITAIGVSTGTNKDLIDANAAAISTTGVQVLTNITDITYKLDESSATETYVNKNDYETGMSTGVSQILAGDNITITPTDGRGIVTINSTGGGAGGSSNHRIALYGGTGASNIYNSSDTLYTNGHWFEVCGATGNVEAFHIKITSATPDAFTIRVWRDGVSTTTLSITAGVTYLKFFTGIRCDENTAIGIDFEDVDENDSPGGVSVVAIFKED